MRTSAKEGGGWSNADTCGQRGGGMKRGRFLRTSFMDDPFDRRVVGSNLVLCTYYISEKNSFIRPFFTLFILSRASDNTTSLNIGGTNAWAVPPPQIFGGTVLPGPPGLRPCIPPSPSQL